MAQYIDKSVVKEEIEKLDNFWHLSKSASGQAFVESLLSFLDTARAKEVDLQKEIHKFIDKEELHLRLWDVDRIAKHFYELGLNEQKGQ